MKKWLLLLVTCIVTGNIQAEVKFTNGHFMVDGVPFTINGMVYAPEPRGWTTKKPEYQVGGKPFVWLCSGAHAEDGDLKNWTSACYDDDLAGQLVNSSDGVNQKYNAALVKRWKHDLDDLQLMGVNTIRLYNINNNRKTHGAFLDELNRRNMKVIYPVLTDWAATNLDDVTDIVDGIVKETCNKPAVIAYTVGNELDVAIMDTPNSRQAKAVRKAADRVHALCPGKPTTYAAVDDVTRWGLVGQKSPLLEAINGDPATKEYADRIDIITVNAGYRGDASQPGAQGAYKNLFDAAHNLTTQYKKPFLIGEVGVHDHDDSGYNRHWFNYVWRIILKDSEYANNIGAVFFEYNDEPLKKTIAGHSNDPYMGVTTAAWPKNATSPNENGLFDFNKTADLANIRKTSTYGGIENFHDGQQTINFPNSSRGAGRWEMFVNDGKGIGACSYKSSPNPQTISPECTKVTQHMKF